MINAATFAAASLRPSPLSRPHPATRLAGLLLGLASAMVLGPVGLAAGLVIVIVGLSGTGLSLPRQTGSLRPWLPVVVLVLAVHTLTTVGAAPLGHPSWAGLGAGLLALGRLSVSVGLLGLYLRVASLDDLIAGINWWLAPLARLGVPISDLGLMVAVALGTAPLVLGEGRRIEMVLRLRRAGAGAATTGPAIGRWGARVVDRARLVVPLLENLVRRAEALELSLRRRRPQAGAGGRPATGEFLVLTLWLVGLVLRGWL